MALSNEVIGRRPSEPALVIGPDDIRPSISGGAGPRPSIYGRPSVHLQVLQKIESSTKDKSPTKRKVRVVHVVCKVYRPTNKNIY